MFFHIPLVPYQEQSVGKVGRGGEGVNRFCFKKINIQNSKGVGKITRTYSRYMVHIMNKDRRLIVIIWNPCT